MEIKVQSRSQQNAEKTPVRSQQDVQKICIHSQRDAKEIYELVSNVSEEIQGEYVGLCHRFPLIVRENGLVAAFGFLMAKGKSDPKTSHGLLLEHYAKVLGFPSTKEMHDSVVKAPLPEYRRLTLRALKLAEWFKRFAEAMDF